MYRLDLNHEWSRDYVSKEKEKKKTLRGTRFKGNPSSFGWHQINSGIIKKKKKIVLQLYTIVSNPADCAKKFHMSIRLISESVTVLTLHLLPETELNCIAMETWRQTVLSNCSPKATQRRTSTAIFMISTICGPIHSNLMVNFRPSIILTSIALAKSASWPAVCSMCELWASAQITTNKTRKETCSL